MNDTNYKLTDDGYGIHTFEIKIIHLTRSEYKVLKKRLFDKGAMYDNGLKSVIIAITEKNSGIRIKLHNNAIPFLEVIVTPRTLLNHNKEPLRILSSKEWNGDKIVSGLKEKLSFYLGDGFGLERFQLTRIDCTATFMFKDPSMTIKYIDLIKRSMKIGRGNIIRCWNAVSEEDYRNQMKHSFQVDFYDTKFTAYDKLYEMLMRDKNYCSDSGFLRIELAYNNIKINEISKLTNISEIIELIKFFCDNAETLIRKFIYYRFSYGDYYSYDAAKEIIDASDLRKNSKYQILEHLMRNYCYDDFDSYIRETKRRLKSDMKYRVMKANMRTLGLNPIPISKWDRSESRLPGMYRLFGITEEEFNNE